MLTHLKRKARYGYSIPISCALVGFFDDPASNGSATSCASSTGGFILTSRSSDSVVVSCTCACAGTALTTPIDRPNLSVAPARVDHIVRKRKLEKRVCPGTSSLRISSRGLLEVDGRRWMRKVATTGTFATVRDRQSSTSAARMTSIPPVVMMYAAWTRETMVVITR